MARKAARLQLFALAYKGSDETLGTRAAGMAETGGRRPSTPASVPTRKSSAHQHRPVRCCVKGKAWRPDRAEGEAMSIDARVLTLLLRWENGREQGQSLMPEQLCAESPELLDEVRQHIYDLEAL